MRAKVLLLALPVAAGVLVGLKLPRWTVVTIEFKLGGTMAVSDQATVLTLPGRLNINDDGRLRLRILNYDTLPHQAGVFAIHALDSAMVGAEACTGRPHAGRMELVLQ